jgi:antitoxin component YwqK of YwqJK toxin-antitoxin module
MKSRYLVVVAAAILAVSCTTDKKEYWPNGNIRSEIRMKGDAYYGPARYWYEDGGIQVSCNYKDNKVDGLMRTYHPNGRIREEQEFSMGIPEGKKMTWNPDGSEAVTCSYRKGQLHGRYTAWYPGRVIRMEGNYAEGREDGIWLYFDVSGKVIGKGNFTRGTGIQKAFYDNGALKQLTRYTDGEKDGDEIFYRPDGTMEVINHYKHGKIMEKTLK